MKWTPGRQGTGYFKKLVATGTWPVAFDLYILKYPEGSGIDWHTDPVPDKRHFRLNIFLRSSTSGGQFVARGEPLIRTRWFELFRPDLLEHMVTTCRGRTRYVLSLGVAIK